ncbi:uncharacterized protein BJ212DRAFT_1446161 [Suillus subaureus]|uniref:CxC1-like cysteine cluster associated with KDZ transposases domain-containing protein n=1 Tax=Suillus subaureus TaxID=48587 RepID=A0A9P7JFZ8_9AGAM|nr:uncharacterized protein BJ212DRAFT_1446161 [Suillus subaureus]KAG1819866.1 hypothetical protein BJ212DRAFT_1446161 [Suillus subaureus]
MSIDEHQALKALKDPSAFSHDVNEDCEDFTFSDVWDGSDALPISHTGGEFGDLARGVLEEVWRFVQHDNHTQHDCVLQRNVAFNEQIPAMSEAYLLWSLEKSQKGFKNFFDHLHSEETEEVVDFDGGQWPMMVVDAFFAEKLLLKISSRDKTIALALVHQGVMPCSPISPVVCITLETLKFYCIAHLRSLHLSIQAFVKTISDLHGIEFHWHLSHQFSIAFNLYHQIRWTVASLIMESLQCDSPDWCLKHACLACQLHFKMLYAMDGNDSLNQNAPEENSCEGRWKNMDDSKTQKAWGIYDEMGIFVAVCHHGFCLLIMDMVQSRELYDISCQFNTTINKTRSLHHTCLVGTFHGHAHRHLCQLFSLTTYTKGVSIEDLETCECTFSKSNSLAPSLWYTSIFHRKQAIDSYFEHNDDLEVYGNLSNFLYSNYKQALDILTNGSDVLPNVIVFESWLEEEKVYLKGLTQEPEEETLQMEYWQRLVGNTCKTESACHHALEDYKRNLKLVQALECKLDIIACWVPDDGEWQRVGRLVANRKYQHALDHLEGLVVACIFELAKMNRAGMVHIAKALQTHSTAIRSALNTYNNITSAMFPPQQVLKWDEVVKYAFLADFNLLCNAQADVSQTPWSLPAAHSAMDLYFKMCQAQEEISCLDVEVCYEDNYLQVSPGFSGTVIPGVSMCMGPGESASAPNAWTPANMFSDCIPVHNLSSPVSADTQEDLDEEEEADEVTEEASRSLQNVLHITDDLSGLQLIDNAELE